MYWKKKFFSDSQKFLSLLSYLCKQLQRDGFVLTCDASETVYNMVSAFINIHPFCLLWVQMLPDF